MPIQKSNIEKRISEIFSMHLKCKIDVSDEVVREDEAKWDSLVNLELVMSIEEAFDVYLTSEQLEEFRSKSWITKIILDAHGAA
jgi:acyl carrier protein